MAPTTGKKIGGVAASYSDAASDANRLSRVKDRIVKAGQLTGIDPAILGAIASRASAAGNSLGLDGYGKYEYSNGYGYMQVDRTAHAVDTSEGPDGQAHFNQAARILQSAIRGVARKHPDWDKSLQIKGGIAAYNFGVSNVQTKENIDVGTTGDDYSSDVLARAKYLRDNGIL